MQINDRFRGKVALVTGAASGIGKAVAIRLGKEGARVALLDRDPAGIAGAVDELLLQGIEVTGHVADICEESEVEKAVREIEQVSQKIDVLVHAAGIVGPTSTRITDYEVSAFDRVYAVNLRGAFLITRAVLKPMEKNGSGRILLIASIAGKEGNPGMAGYSTTKAGVIALAKGVAKEYATTGITVNALAPAVIKTPMNDNTSPEQLSYMIAKIPMQRLGTVEEVAAVSCFIVSEENSFTTGFVYDISGGRATY